MQSDFVLSSFFFFNDTATTEIYTLSLHDALPISGDENVSPVRARRTSAIACGKSANSVNAECPRSKAGRTPTASSPRPSTIVRSEEHTSELQSRLHLVCRLLLEKKKKKNIEFRNASKI